jgi:hypothetical protein
VRGLAQGVVIERHFGPTFAWISTQGLLSLLLSVVLESSHALRIERSDRLSELGCLGHA